MGSGSRLQSWLALHLVPGMGPVTCNKFVAHFGGPDRVLAAPTAELTKICSLRRESIGALSDKGRQDLLAAAEGEINRAAEKGIAILACDDPLYPELLQNIHDPPVVLYVLGRPELLTCKGIGIVGSRAATHYGKDIAGRMGCGLAGHGFTVISGMALGIDTAAHKGALAADSGKTIAVLGCGLDIVYPPGNGKLFEEIGTRGAVVSEYPFGTEPESFRFPARNRIISGLSLGIVVVEAASRSGSLITANLALEQGREVFAVPGRIDSAKSTGTHTLLQQGAKLVHSISDIVEEFSYINGRDDHARQVHGEKNGQEAPEQLNPEEAQLLGCLDVYPRTIDEIIRETDLSPRKVSELLLHLELKGMVQSLPGKTFQRCSPPIRQPFP